MTFTSEQALILLDCVDVRVTSLLLTERALIIVEEYEAARKVRILRDKVSDIKHMLEEIANGYATC